MNAQDLVEREVQKLHQAFEVSKTQYWSLEGRIIWLKDLDYRIAKAKDEILSTVANEMKLSEHTVLVDQYVPLRSWIKWWKKNAHEILCDENRSRSLLWLHKRGIVRKEPLGVIGIITPHNSAFSLPLGGIIESLLTGNAALLKPAENRRQTTALLNRLVEESLTVFDRADMFCVLSEGIEYAKALGYSPLVDKILFTGSDKTGRKVHQANAQVRFTPVRLELGGSNPAIVLEDADLNRAANVIVWARFSDISCNNIKRVFVVEAVFMEFFDIIVKKVSQLQPHEIDCCLSDQERATYNRFLQDMDIDPDKEEVLPILIGIQGKNRDRLILKEETFVPILPVVKVKNDKEAVELANSTQFGLGASIFTRDRERFVALADKLECGTVLHNDAMTEYAMVQLPFGGWKASGSGYTHGPEGLLELVRIKNVISERWFGKFVANLPLYPWTEKKMKLLRKLSDILIKFG
ncbi:aldehyde dehydrogenase family protein [Patescibacteria group bacterium AH-259-L05]|nr:aldehyde dehydrogenase family protein [Patescibacteria group bacterium AH-259-L05]